MRIPQTFLHLFIVRSRTSGQNWTSSNVPLKICQESPTGNRISNTLSTQSKLQFLNKSQKRNQMPTHTSVFAERLKSCHSQQPFNGKFYQNGGHKTSERRNLVSPSNLLPSKMLVHRHRCTRIKLISPSGLQAIGSLSPVEIFFGRFLRRKFYCPQTRVVRMATESSIPVCLSNNPVVTCSFGIDYLAMV